MNWLKQKRILWIAFAVLFLILIFIIKFTSVFENTEVYKKSNKENGLIYSNISLEDLVNKDTDGDEILDWEEGLYGLDPTKKETTAGVPDSVAMSKLRSTQGNRTGTTDTKNEEPENLTETDKFSRELFATIAATSQNGAVDQATIDQMGSALADHIQNTLPRKVFLISDIKVINDSSTQALTNYTNALGAIVEKNRLNYTALDVLQEFMADENNVDVSALSKLDPIIEQTNKIIQGMIKMNVPQSISALHLNVINSLERMAENASDIQLFESDTIVALSGISKYEENAAELDKNLNDLANAINQKLNN